METDLQTKVNRLEVSVDLLQAQFGEFSIFKFLCLSKAVRFNQTHADDRPLFD